MILISFLALAILTCGHCNPTEYDAWRAVHGVQKRDGFKSLMFNKNSKYVAHHNDMVAQFKLKLNEFADQNFNDAKATIVTHCNINIKPDRGDAFENFSWPPGYSQIRNQGSCGSCYAMAAIAVVEMHNAIHYKTSKSLSVQSVLDCSKKGNPCLGGNVSDALQHLQSTNHVSESEWPYRGKQETKPPNLSCECLKKIAKPDFNFTTLPSPSTFSNIKDILRNDGAVTIGLYTDFESFKLYDEGIFDDKVKCNEQTKIDHAAVIVGYGYNTTWKKNYWIIKNSWGSEWGERGYMKIAADSQCLKLCSAFYLNKPPNNYILPVYGNKPSGFSCNLKSSIVTQKVPPATRKLPHAPIKPPHATIKFPHTTVELSHATRKLSITQELFKTLKKFPHATIKLPRTNVVLYHAPQKLTNATQKRYKTSKNNSVKLNFWETFLILNLVFAFLIVDKIFCSSC